MLSDKKYSQAATGIKRRSFLKGVLTASAISGFPYISSVGSAAEEKNSGKAKSGQKVNIACCGIGNRGADVINGLLDTGLINIVALCDTDMGAKHTQNILKKFPDVPRFTDFRKMFDKMGKQFEAVSVGVPDFAHFPITMLAASQGKHVYVEKPMARTFQEVELMMAAEKKYKVACQMGNQGHSEANYFQFEAWTKAGIIKNVKRIDAFMNSPRRWHGHTPESLLKAGDQPQPETLDWDTWLGTAQDHKYNANYVNGQWRCWYDFGMGALGDWAAHILDTAHQFLDLGLPSEIAAVHEDGPSDAIFPQATTLKFNFPARGDMPPVDVTWYDGKNNKAPLPTDFGDSVVDPNIPPPTSGKISSAPGKVIYGEGLTFKGGSHGSILEIIPKEKANDIAAKLPKFSRGNSDHFKNFLLSCMGEETCRSSFAVAGPLSQMMALGVIAQRLNAKLSFDRTTKQITNNKSANELLSQVPRKGWEEFYKMA